MKFRLHHLRSSKVFPKLVSSHACLELGTASFALLLLFWGFLGELDVDGELVLRHIDVLSHTDLLQSTQSWTLALVCLPALVRASMYKPPYKAI